MPESYLVPRLTDYHAVAKRMTYGGSHRLLVVHVIQD